MRIPRMRVWSFVNQYSQTLKSVGWTVVKDLEYLYLQTKKTERYRIAPAYFATFRFLYLSLLYSVLSE
jgi:hypothetical protein